jgi:geranylgeranyl diphosphate synthase type I
MTLAATPHLSLLRPQSLRDANTSPDLRDPEGLDAVEQRMRWLARGDLRERAGDMVHQHIATGGKRLRARLALAALEALGGALPHGVAWAAAVELLHNATLIHDDIQDGDTMRRGAPTLWTVHGVAQAINAGDLMLMLPFVALEGAPHEVRGDLACALARYASRVVRGQVQELDLLGRGTLSWDAYMHSVRGKTAALMALPVHGAVLLAGRGPGQAEALSEAFETLGILFQLQDDVLDLYGDKGRDEVGADLYEGKVSALVVAHLDTHADDRQAILELLRQPRERTSRADVLATIERFRTAGSLRRVLDCIDALAQSVRHDQALEQEPALHAVARQLVNLVLAPIDHVRRQRDAAPRKDLG